MSYLPIGTLIKIFCREALVESGSVSEHTEDRLVLNLEDGSVFIINNPNDNVIAIKIPLKNEVKSSSVPDSVYVDTELKPDKYYRDESLRAASLAELRKKLAKQERENAKALMNRKNISHKEVEFGLPDFSKPVYKYPKKKA